MKLITFSRKSVLVTTAIAGLLILDLALPGYRKFALIPELKPKVAIATSSVSKTVTTVTTAVTSFSPQKATVRLKARATPTPFPCTSLLSAYRQGASQCKEFTPPTY